MTTEVVDDFEVSKAVFEKLKDLSKERQERVLRWVTEGLGLSHPTAASSPSGQTLPPPDAGANPPSPASPPQGGTNIKSFVAAKKPRSDQQFATVVAYYYRFEAPPALRRETINTEVVQEAARLAGRERLVNPTSTLNNARNQGYLDRSERGEFTINTVGENLVAMTLPAEGSTAPSRRPAPKRRAAKRPASKRAAKRSAR